MTAVDGREDRNKMVERSLLRELCEELGHDPNKVGRIVLDPKSVEVVYVHHVSG